MRPPCLPYERRQPYAVRLAALALCAGAPVLPDFRPFGALLSCGWYVVPARPRSRLVGRFFVPCFNRLYKHQRAAVVAVALFRLPCRVSVLALRLRGLLAAPVRINIRRRDYSPRGLRCPCQSINARFAYFPPFWRPFGVAVVYSAGAVSLRPFRWCRCAYKVAAPVWPCFRPCSLQMVSRASLAAVSCPIICTPSDISPTSHNGNNTPQHGRAVLVLAPPPLCIRLRAACWWCLVAIAPCQLLAALLSRWGRINIRQYPPRPRGGGGIAPPPCLPCQSFK